MKYFSRFACVCAFFVVPLQPDLLWITMAQSLSQLFFESTGKKAGEQTALTASGSNRRYYRIESEDKTASLIGVQGTSRDENHAFL